MFSDWNVEVLVRIKKSKKGMNKLSLFTLVIGMFISLGGEAQNLNEIGIGLTTDSDHRLFLNYKLGLKEKRSINFRLSQGWILEKVFGTVGFTNQPQPQRFTLRNLT